jgi:hypothetical protein
MPKHVVSVHMYNEEKKKKKEKKGEEQVHQKLD